MMKFWDGQQYRPISPEEAAYRIAEGQVPIVTNDIPPGVGCPMCEDDLLHVHVDTATREPAAPVSPMNSSAVLPAADVTADVAQLDVEASAKSKPKAKK